MQETSCSLALPSSLNPTLVQRSHTLFLHYTACISAIKENLCISLLQNCVSPIATEFQPALSIFALLATSFRDHLKTEIGVFFQNVLLAILESSNATFQQKYLVIQTLHRVCQDPQVIIDIFLNYDCDLGLIPHVMEGVGVGVYSCVWRVQGCLHWWSTLVVVFGGWSTLVCGICPLRVGVCRGV